MNISVFDLFNIGIGPSSSHCIGPMRAAKSFALALQDNNLLNLTEHITIDLYGSLAFTGKGHGTDKALALGLEGYDPETVEPDQIPTIQEVIANTKKLQILQQKSISYIQQQNLFLHFNETLPGHSNGMQFSAFDANHNLIFNDIYYSTGGGFIVNAATMQLNVTTKDDDQLPYPFETATELLQHCQQHNLSIAQVVHANELHWRKAEEIENKTFKIWQTMDEAISRGCNTTGVLPGGLKVPRRAAELYKKLQGQPISTTWLNIFAIAVNEENAAGGRVVTAPTNGASGIVPAVLKYYRELQQDFTTESIVKFILTAGAIGILFKKGASISGAEMGCQGEVGVASSMAAGALTAVLGGTPQQVEQAAEIAIEHNLGLTCDPIKGLVQIPCIERNAMGAVKAVNASTIALLEKGQHIVSLDSAIRTMKATGQDMSSHYKETSQGGLAVNVPEC